MFVKSNMDVLVKYNKGNDFIEIKPMTVTYIRDGLVTPKELMDCYGQRIVILSNDQVERVIEEQVIDNEIEKFEKKEEVAGSKIKDPEGAEGEEANTGDADVDDFLNGKTDVVPEGTEEITEEEALKLKAQADAEAKAKEEAEKLEALKAKEAAEKAKAKEEAKAKSAAKSAKTPAKKASKKNNK